VGNAFKKQDFGSALIRVSYIIVASARWGTVYLISTAKMLVFYCALFGFLEDSRSLQVFV
jgi:hypothetical protein